MSMPVDFLDALTKNIRVRTVCVYTLKIHYACADTFVHAHFIHGRRDTSSVSNSSGINDNDGGLVPDHLEDDTL